MFRAAYNRAAISVRLAPMTPVSVSDRANEDPSRPEAALPRMLSASGETPFLPAATIRGALRAACAQVLRKGSIYVCMAADEKASCSGFYAELRRRMRRGEENAGEGVPAGMMNAVLALRQAPERMPYAAGCPACRTFGSTQQAGKIFVSDGLPFPCEPQQDVDGRYGQGSKRGRLVETRAAAGPDRRQEGPPAFMEVMAGGFVEAEITIENFEVWQLCIVAAGLRVVSEGIVRIGSGGRRGMGRVAVKFTGFEAVQRGPLRGAGSIAGVGEVRRAGPRPGPAEGDRISAAALGKVAPEGSDEPADFSRRIDGIEERFIAREGKAEEFLAGRLLQEPAWEAFLRRERAG